MARGSIRALAGALLLTYPAAAQIQSFPHSIHKPAPASAAVHIAIIAPAHPQQLADVQIVVHVSKGPQIAPLRQASVALSLSMPSMAMPPNTIACRPGAPGYYSGEGVFTMSGDWTITATVSLPKGVRIVASRSVTVR